MTCEVRNKEINGQCAELLVRPLYIVHPNWTRKRAQNGFLSPFSRIGKLNLTLPLGRHFILQNHCFLLHCLSVKSVQLAAITNSKNTPNNFILM